MTANNYYTEYIALRRYYRLICNSFLDIDERIKFLKYLDNLDEILTRKRNSFNYRKRNRHILKSGVSVKKFEPNMLSWD